MENSEITITTATEDDLNEILQLQLLCYQSEAIICQDFNIPPLRYDMDKMSQEFAEKRIFKVMLGNRIIGSVRGYAEGETAYLEKLIVHPDFQNRGLGRKLALHFEQQFAECKYIELFTGSKSLKNIAFYHNLGYQTFREKKISDDYSFLFLRKETKSTIE